MKELVVALLMLATASSYGTTWVESEVDDPIKEGAKCRVNNPASYGGYIYNWPSKYDQVFWPYTDINSIWFCDESGYASFMADFEDLNEDEKNRIAKYLKDNKARRTSDSQLISLLENLYKIRDVSSVYRNKLKRVFARWYQKFGDLEKATHYRRAAYAEIESALEGDLSKETKLEYLYVAANYARLFEEKEKSDQFLTELEEEIKVIQDPDLLGYGEYLSELAKDTSYISPGQKLEPTVREKNK